MLLRRNLPLLLTCLALAACTTKADGPGFGDLEPGSPGDSGSTATDGGSDDDVTVDRDASMDDASMPPPSTRKDAGSADAGREVDASGMDDAEGSETGSNAETGRLEGITAAHNAVRAMVMTQPALPDLTWSPTLAAYAQEWATQLASSPSTCASPQHRSGADLQAKNYGENLAAFSGRGQTGNVSTAQQAVDGWSSEVTCWTYGTIRGTEQCNMTCTDNLHSDGCGHYTPVEWRKSLELGSGAATSPTRQFTEDIRICTYSPAGNILGQAPY